MKLTAQELEQMKSVNIGAVSADALADVSGMAFDRTLPPGDAGGLSYPAKERAVTAVAACSHFETKCPEASASLSIPRNRVII